MEQHHESHYLQQGQDKADGHQSELQQQHQSEQQHNGAQQPRHEGDSHPAGPGQEEKDEEILHLADSIGAPPVDNSWEVNWRNKIMWRLAQRCDSVMSSLAMNKLVLKEDVDVLDVFIRNAGRMNEAPEDHVAQQAAQAALTLSAPFGHIQQHEPPVPPGLVYPKLPQKRGDGSPEQDDSRKRQRTNGAVASKQRRFYRYISVTKHTFDISAGCDEATLIEAQEKGILPKLQSMELVAVLTPPSEATIRRLDIGRSGHAIKSAPGGTKRQMDILAVNVLNAVLKTTNVEAFKDIVAPIMSSRAERVQGVRMALLSRPALLNTKSLPELIRSFLEDILHMSLLNASAATPYAQTIAQIGAGVMRDVLGLQPHPVSEEMTMAQWLDNVPPALEAFAIYTCLLLLGSEARLNVSAEEHRRALYDPILRAMEMKRTAEIEDDSFSRKSYVTSDGVDVLESLKAIVNDFGHESILPLFVKEINKHAGQ